MQSKRRGARAELCAELSRAERDAQVRLSNGYEGWALVANELSAFGDVKTWAESVGIQLAGPYKAAYASSA